MRLPKLPLVVLLASLGFVGIVPVSAQTAKRQPAERAVRVAAAADLQPVMPAFAAAFEKDTGIKLTVSIASSGTLATQIENGAPFDIFLGADFSFPEKIVAAGLADERDPVAYAKGTLVLWARKDLGIVPFTIDTLTDPRVKTVAIANADHAPFGRAGISALDKLRMLDAVKPKLVVAENVAQTGQFIQSGNAQVGFISLTLANSPGYKDIGQYTLVPLVYPEIRQCAVVIKGSAHNAEAHRFLDWLLTEDVQGHLKDFGLSPVK
jgi:molybdate transport system substrate-binding protein